MDRSVCVKSQLLFPFNIPIHCIRSGPRYQDIHVLDENMFFLVVQKSIPGHFLDTLHFIVKALDHFAKTTVRLVWVFLLLRARTVIFSVVYGGHIPSRTGRATSVSDCGLLVRI